MYLYPSFLTSFFLFYVTLSLCQSFPSFSICPPLSISIICLSGHTLSRRKDVSWLNHVLSLSLSLEIQFLHRTIKMSFYFGLCSAHRTGEFRKNFFPVQSYIHFWINVNIYWKRLGQFLAFSGINAISRIGRRRRKIGFRILRWVPQLCPEEENFRRTENNFCSLHD